MLNLYSETMWYAKKISYSYCWDLNVVDDFMQISYLALDVSVKAFNPERGFPFLAYYRKWLVHYFYRYSLEMRFPLKIPRSAEIDTGLTESVTKKLLVASLQWDKKENSFAKIEFETLKDIIWERVDTDLTEENAAIIRGRFINLRTLSDLGKEFDIGAERVRLREFRSLKKLSKDKILQEIATDFFCDGNYVFDTYTGVA